jgi:hypothetical protein
MAGGILRRLALEAAKEYDVLLGPTDDVFVSGVCLSDGSNKNKAYWDDALTKAEIELICGVYKVETGENYCLFIILPTNSRPTRCSQSNGEAAVRDFIVAQAIGLGRIRSQRR